MWDTACPDWEERLLARRPLVPDLPLFADQADKAERIFNRLRIPDVIGTPTMANAAGDWIRAIVRALFGSYDAERHRRMIQEVFLLVPKKNSKSSSAASIMVTALIMNERPAAEFLLIAPTKEIADIAFKQAAGLIALDKELAKLFHPQRHIRTITHRRSGAMMQVKAADTDVITGSKSTGILVDETHVFAKKPNAADIFVEIRGALAARPDGFMIQITTQSKDPPAGVFASELRNARDVRDGKLRLPLLPVLYELPERVAADDGWKAPETWPLVNPNLGRSVDEGFLRRELLKAEREGPAQLALLASQHFNVEVGLRLRRDRWAGADKWEAAAEPSLTLDELLEQSEVVCVGIDGGGLDDLFGLAVLGRHKVTKHWLLWVHAWAYRGVLTLRKSEAARLLDFERDGDLTVVDRLGDDIEGIAAIVKRIDDAGLLARVGLDPVGVGAVVDALDGIEVNGDRVVGISQGWKLSGAIKTAERKLADGTLRHGGRPLMAWCVGNAKVEPRGNATTITKQAAGTAKIDPLMAAFDAVALMAMNPEAKGIDMDDFLKNPIWA
ncbi:terminase large subunit [Methylobacterium sp. C1]|uniref:terminase large subunit n=1 Tax=Methylobacterium sp. C1 TaxID=1479019 RepID=UPI0008D9EF28|nr:terminase large subunit [Methylobacterium sp. C1]